MRLELTTSWLGFANWQGYEAEGTNSVGALCTCVCVCAGETELQSMLIPFNSKSNALATVGHVFLGFLAGRDNSELLLNIRRR